MAEEDTTQDVERQAGDQNPASSVDIRKINILKTGS
jgi:hypothetical protein